ILQTIPSSSSIDCFLLNFFFQRTNAAIKSNQSQQLRSNSRTPCCLLEFQPLWRQADNPAFDTGKRRRRARVWHRTHLPPKRSDGETCLRRSDQGDPEKRNTRYCLYVAPGAFTKGIHELVRRIDWTLSQMSFEFLECSHPLASLRSAIRLGALPRE